MVETQALVQAAVEAAGRAYCPYSHFQVGAAVVGDDGKLYTGCNIENASYGLTNCAERTAIFKAVSAGCRAIRALAVAGGTPDQPATPCGACRQVMAEFGKADLPVSITDRDGKTVRTLPLGELLPLAFSLHDA
ncbi:MAG: cytidine deaminase [Kiritimatiellae bacterium]|nr:cytidine deaminase [Kiritimatiellia bacterium]